MPEVQHWRVSLQVPEEQVIIYVLLQLRFFSTDIADVNILFALQTTDIVALFGRDKLVASCSDWRMDVLTFEASLNDAPSECFKLVLFPIIRVVSMHSKRHCLK